MISSWTRPFYICLKHRVWYNKLLILAFAGEGNLMRKSVILLLSLALCGCVSTQAAVPAQTLHDNFYWLGQINKATDVINTECARPASTSAMACNTSASAALPVSTLATR